MDEQSRSWLRGCAIGCGAIVLLASVLTTVGAFRVLRRCQAAADAQAELKAQVGTEADFTPTADGSIPDDRIEAFLEIRGGLADLCARLAAAAGAVARLEDLSREQDPSRAEVLRRAASATWAMLGTAPLMGELFEHRNRLLVEARMDLGEYSYLYVTAYHGLLASQLPAPDRRRSGILDGSPVNRRIHSLFEAMLRRQLDAARTAGLGEDWLAALEREIAAMAADPRRIPWQDGLPEPILGSLEPYRDRLDATSCIAAAEVELLRVRPSLPIASE